MKLKHSILSVVILAVTSLCPAADGGPFSPDRVIIRAESSGWGLAVTNLTLVLSNGVYSAGTYTVAPALVSNLIAVAQRPWPKAGTNSWPSYFIDPANLGLNAAWVKSNYQRLLQAYSGESGKGVFPNASVRQRTWLTNGLADMNLLEESARGYFRTMWTDDYPSLELRFENDNGQGVVQLFRLNTQAQHSFMLPWQVHDGTMEFTSGNADISRALAQILPPGFLLRDRLSGDLFGLIVGEFPNVGRVQEFMKKSLLEETLGDEAKWLL